MTEKASICLMTKLSPDADQVATSGSHRLIMWKVSATKWQRNYAYGEWSDDQPRRDERLEFWDLNAGHTLAGFFNEPSIRSNHKYSLDRNIGSCILGGGFFLPPWLKSEVLAPFKRFLSGSAPSDSVDGGGEVGGSYSVAKCASLCIGDAPSVDMSGMFRFVTSNAGVKSMRKEVEVALLPRVCERWENEATKYALVLHYEYY